MSWTIQSYNTDKSLVPVFLSILRELIVKRCVETDEQAYAFSVGDKMFTVTIDMMSIISEDRPSYYIVMHRAKQEWYAIPVYGVVWEIDADDRGLDDLVCAFLKDHAFYAEYVTTTNLISDDEVKRMFFGKMGIDLDGT